MNKVISFELDNFNEVYGVKFANQTVEFFTEEEQKDFEQELTVNKPKFKYFKNKDYKYYKENPIEYSINNYGFRTPVNFKKGLEGNVFLGCSYTFGIGHYLENVWSWKVNEHVGGNFLNLAVPGHGIMTAARVLYAFKDMLEYKNIFLHIPHHYRYTFYDPYEEKWQSVSPHFDTLGGVEQNQKIVLASDNNMILNYISALALIKEIGKQHNAKLFSIKEFRSTYKQKILNKWIKENRNAVPVVSRDFIHPSVPYMDIFSKHVIDAYEKDIQAYDKTYKDLISYSTSLDLI